MEREPRLDPVPIDVGRLVQRNVASLFSHLVTRPTGRAVRLAIERRLAEAAGPALFLIDLSEVTVLDFSCADEVVAKLLLRHIGPAPPRKAFFLLRGVGDAHRDPIEAVLARQALAAVAELRPGTYELLGQRSPEEDRVWLLLESRGTIDASEAESLAPRPPGRAGLDGLVRRHLAYRAPGGEYHALSRLVRGLPGG